MTTLRNKRWLSHLGQKCVNKELGKEEEAHRIPSLMSFCQVSFRIKRLRDQYGLDSPGRATKVDYANPNSTLAEEASPEEGQTWGQGEEAVRPVGPEYLGRQMLQLADGISGTQE